MNKTFWSITIKTMLVHTSTYFLMGLLAYTLLDYSAKYTDPIVSNFMRQTDHPFVAAGPALQILRGFLFGLVFYWLREITLERPRGWLTLWGVLVIVGIFSPFGPSPSSIEGVLYTIMPSWFHIVGLPEVLLQSLLLAFLTHYWTNHAGKKWLGWVFGTVFGLTILFSLLGIFAALGYLPTP